MICLDSDHHAIGFYEVVDSAPSFRNSGFEHMWNGNLLPPDVLLHLLRGADRHRGLGDERSSATCFTDGVRDVQYVPKVGRPVFMRRGANCNEDHFGVRDRAGDIGR